MKRQLLGFLAALTLATAAHAQGSSGGCGNGATCTSLAVLPQSASYTVGSGGNFATLTAAIAALNTQVLQPGALVSLNVLDGGTTEPGAVMLSSSFGKQILIQSQNRYDFTLSSVQSSSGVAGAWTYVLNLNSVTNIAVGDYLSIYGVSGGTNPTYLAGVWPVTAVDSVNKRATITTTGRQAAAASGVVIGTVTDNKGVVRFTGSDGLDVWNGATGVNLLNITFVGDGSGGHYGLSLQDGDRINADGVLAVYGFGAGNVLVLFPSELNTAAYLIASGSGGVGIIAENDGTIDGPHLISTGNASHDFYALTNGSITYGVDALASGGGGNGLNTYMGGVISGTATYATGNVGAGVNTGTGGQITPGTLTEANNGAADNLQFNWGGGFTTTGNVGIGYNVVPALPLDVLGNGRFTGTSVSLRNTSGSTVVWSANSNGQAQMQFNDQTGAQKWEFGHIGSSSYDLRLWNDGLGKATFTASASTNRTTFNGDLGTSGTIPTVSGTGTPTIATGSTDTAGEVTAGASATSVVITFAAAKTNAPFCTVTDQSQLSSFAYTISTTAITVTQTATTGNKIDYQCAQH